MADGLQSFLVDLATDSAKLGEFIRNPDASMEAAQLDEQDRAAQQSGNPAAIYSRLSGQPAAPGSAVPPTTVVIVDLVSAGEQSIPVIRQPQAGIVYAAAPQPGIVYASPLPPQGGIVYAAQSPQPVYSAAPLPVYSHLPVYAPHPGIVYAAPPTGIVYAAPPPPVYAPHQAGIVYTAQPQTGIVYTASPQAGLPVYAPQAGSTLPVYGG